MKIGDLFIDCEDNHIMVAVVVKDTYAHLMSLGDQAIYVYNREDWCYLRKLLIKENKFFS